MTDWNQVSKPFSESDYEWATNANYSAGAPATWQGTPTKIAPTAGRKEDGNRPRDEPAAQVDNYRYNALAQMVSWVADSRKNPNLIINPTAQRGNQFWFDGGVEKAITGYADGGGGDVTATTAPAHGLANGDTVRIYNTTNYDGIYVIANVAGADFDFTPAGGWLGDDGASNYVNLDDPASVNPGAANLDVSIWDEDDQLAGSKWELSGASGGFVADISEKIKSAAAIKIALSAEQSTSVYVAGNAYMDIVCYDSSDKYLGAISELNVSANQGAWARAFAFGTTPANTDYVRIRKWFDEDWDSTSISIRKLKIERGEFDTGYSDEASQSLYLSARYKTNASQVVAGGATDIIDFEDKFFDDPGTDRVTIGASWKFTAERYMKVEVSVAIEVEIGAGDWDLGEFLALRLVYNQVGGAPALYAELDMQEAEVALAGAYNVKLKGSDLIELNNGDSFNVSLVNSIGANATLDGQATKNYISIREIT